MTSLELTSVAPPAYDSQNNNKRDMPSADAANGHYVIEPEVTMQQPASYRADKTPKEKMSPNHETDNDSDDDDDDNDDDDDESSNNPFLNFIKNTQEGIWSFLHENRSLLTKCFLVLLAIGFAVYFGLAMAYEFGSEDSVRLLWMLSVGVLGGILYLVYRYGGDSIAACCTPLTNKITPHGTIISWVVVIIIFLFNIIYLIIDVALVSKDINNLISGSGLIVYVLLLFVFSKNPAKVSWRAVVWGLALQFLFAILILRTSVGKAAFSWLGDRVNEFLEHTDAGSIFVFGDNYFDHFLAFKVLPVVVFFSTMISILYYLGVMQVVIRAVAVVMQFCMGTTAGESLNAAGNIFIGQAEAPLMIKPLLKHMTRSELHAVMTGGFATIAGSVLGAYISFGAPANHLLSASVMSAPAALAMAKLSYPETRRSRNTSKHVQKMGESEAKNLIEAVSLGAASSIKLVASIAVNLIAFVAILHFINATLCWLSLRAGMDPQNCLSLEYVFSFVFYPFAVAMGIERQDCRKVAELIGVKTFLTEFVAYTRLGKLITNKKILDAHLLANGTYEWEYENIILFAGNGTAVGSLRGGYLSDRSVVITTYALCGFASFVAMGVALGVLGALLPKKKTILAKMVVRAMIAGNVACFMTACIAGLFYTSDRT